MNKLNKSEEAAEVTKYLRYRLGNTTQIKKRGPLCEGQFNTTKGKNVRIIGYSQL